MVIYRDFLGKIVGLYKPETPFILPYFNENIQETF